MVGQVKLSYSNNDLIKLIKRDIEHKFGQRDLVGIDLGISDIYKSQARVVSYPAPVVKITSVEDQIKQLNIPTLPQVPRSATSVKQDTARVGGSTLVYNFDRVRNTLRISGGPVLWSSSIAGAAPTGGHWVGVFIGFPLGLKYEVGDKISFSINGRPSYMELPYKEEITYEKVEEAGTDLDDDTTNPTYTVSNTTDAAGNNLTEVKDESSETTNGTTPESTTTNPEGTSSASGETAQTEGKTETGTKEGSSDAGAGDSQGTSTAVTENQGGADSGSASEGGEIKKYTLKEVVKKSLAEEGITLYFNAQYTENEVVINWDDNYEPEKIKVIIDSTLEDTAFPKYPMLPKEPKLEFKYPDQVDFCKADIKVDVDLAMGLGTSCNCFAR